MGSENARQLTPAQAICQDNFDLKRYVGRWFEMQREANTPFQKGEHGTADYSFTEAHPGIRVVNTEYLADQQKTNQVIGKAELRHPTRAACVVAFSKFQPWGDYRVLATDYETFSVVYSKSDRLMNKILRFEFMWILTREPMEIDSPSWKEMKAKTDQIIKEKLPEFDLERLHFTVHESGHEYAEVVNAEK